METNYVKQAYEAALKAGLCDNKTEFAQLVGFDRSNIFRAEKQGPSPRLVIRIEKILNEHGIVLNGSNAVAVTQNNTEEAQPIATDPLLAELTAAREMYDKHLTEVLRQNSQLIQIIAQKNG